MSLRILLRNVGRIQRLRPPSCLNQRTATHFHIPTASKFCITSEDRWYSSTVILCDDEAQKKDSKKEAKKKAKELAKKQQAEKEAAAKEAEEKEQKQEEIAEKAPENVDESTDSKDATNDDDDDVPVWQNPLHHNNPDFQPEKVFVEDFEPGEEMPQVPAPPLDDGSGKVLAPPHVHELADQILNLTMLEMNDLVNKIGDHFGFEDNDGAMVGGETQGGGADAEPEAKQEEKTAFDLKLTGFDAKAKIKVIKEVRAIAGLGLKEAKEMVEGAPATIKKEIKKEEAEELKKKLEEVGATVEIL